MSKKKDSTRLDFYDSLEVVSWLLKILAYYKSRFVPLDFLAEELHKKKVLVRSEKVSRKEYHCRRVRVFLDKLVKAGYVKSTTGSFGGYMLTEKPDMTLLDFFIVFKGYVPTEERVKYRPGLRGNALRNFQKFERLLNLAKVSVGNVTED
jgi:hypothetical protein